MSQSDYKYDIPEDKLKAYRDKAGCVCPLCGSGDTETKDHDHAYTTLVFCRNCGEQYLEVLEVKNVLLKEPYVKPLDEYKDEVARDAFSMLFLVNEFLQSARTYGNTPQEILNYLRRKDFDHLLDNIGMLYERIGKEEDVDPSTSGWVDIRFMWAQAAKSRLDDLMGFDL